MWVSTKDALLALHITRKTLHSWAVSGKIQVKKLSTRKFLYNLNSVANFQEEVIRKNVVYGRVSNTEQKDDLSRQLKLIKEYMIANGVIPDLVFSDIASGMNEDRTDLCKLLQLIIAGEINKVYISYKDRLTRFGFGYMEQIFKMHGTTIEIVNLTDESDFQSELTEDLVSVIHHFSMEMHSNSRKMLKQVAKDLLTTP